MTYFFCPECRSQCSPQDMCCPNCGFVLASLRRCTECGAVIYPGNMKCAQCGCPVTPAVSQTSTFVKGKTSRPFMRRVFALLSILFTVSAISFLIFIICAVNYADELEKVIDKVASGIVGEIISAIIDMFKNPQIRLPDSSFVIFAGVSLVLSGLVIPLILGYVFLELSLSYSITVTSSGINGKIPFMSGFKLPIISVVRVSTNNVDSVAVYTASKTYVFKDIENPEQVYYAISTLLTSKQQ